MYGVFLEDLDFTIITSNLVRFRWTGCGDRLGGEIIPASWRRHFLFFARFVSVEPRPR